MSDPQDLELPDELNQLLLISGQSTSGKSMSARNIRNQEKWFLFNTEAGKRPPFKNKFNNIRISNPYEVIGHMDELLENQDQVEGCILDTYTFWMDMMENQYVNGAADTQKAWGAYGQLPKTLLQQKVAAFGKPFIVMAHAAETLVGNTRTTCVPCKGQMGKIGLEAYFSTVVMAKRMSLKDLAPYLDNGLLNVTEDEEYYGVKHVFQTRQDPEAMGERIRSPHGMFSRKQMFMDNDAQMLLDHMAAYYA